MAKKKDKMSKTAPKMLRRKPLTESEAKQFRNKWNVPDWRCPEGYEGLNDLEGDDLRWEFVRRDVNFRKAWEKKEKYFYFDYGLKTLVNPDSNKAPKFIRPCSLLEFPERNIKKQAMHYEALASSAKDGGLMFSLDVYHPIKPQLKFIEAIYWKKHKYLVDPSEPKPRPNRKNNKTGRKPEFLLRVLDADNEGVLIPEMAEVFGGMKGINTSTMERTVDFAKKFWKRL
jgi:hypothetical protein